MKKLVAGSLLLAALAVGGCAKDTPEVGRVLDRQYTPSREWQERGDWKYQAPVWKLKLRDGGREAWVTVPGDVYNRCDVGMVCDTRHSIEQN